MRDLRSLKKSERKRVLLSAGDEVAGVVSDSTELCKIRGLCLVAVKRKGLARGEGGWCVL